MASWPRPTPPPVMQRGSGKDGCYDGRAHIRTPPNTGASINNKRFYGSYVQPAIDGKFLHRYKLVRFLAQGGSDLAQNFSAIATTSPGDALYVFGIDTSSLHIFRLASLWPCPYCMARPLVAFRKSDHPPTNINKYFLTFFLYNDINATNAITTTNAIK